MQDSSDAVDSVGFSPAGHPVHKRLWFFDRQGCRISRETWNWLSADNKYVQLANDTYVTAQGEISVTTFWLGIPEAAGPTGSRIFRTLIDDSTTRCLMWAWEGEEEAILGHQAILEWLRRNIPPVSSAVPGTRG